MISHRLCPCTGVYEEHLVAVVVPCGETTMELREVPEGVCPACGSRVYPAAALRAIESAFSGDPTPPPP